LILMNQRTSGWHHHDRSSVRLQCWDGFQQSGNHLVWDPQYLRRENRPDTQFIHACTWPERPSSLWIHQVSILRHSSSCFAHSSRRVVETRSNQHCGACPIADWPRYGLALTRDTMSTGATPCSWWHLRRSSTVAPVVMTSSKIAACFWLCSVPHSLAQ